MTGWYELRTKLTFTRLFNPYTASYRYVMVHDFSYRAATRKTKKSKKVLNKGYFI